MSSPARSLGPVQPPDRPARAPRIPPPLAAAGRPLRPLPYRQRGDRGQPPGDRHRVTPVARACALVRLRDPSPELSLAWPIVCQALRSALPALARSALTTLWVPPLGPPPPHTTTTGPFPAPACPAPAAPAAPTAPTAPTAPNPPNPPGHGQHGRQRVRRAVERQLAPGKVLGGGLRRGPERARPRPFDTATQLLCRPLRRFHASPGLFSLWPTEYSSPVCLTASSRHAL